MNIKKLLEKRDDEILNSVENILDENDKRKTIECLIDEIKNNRSLLDREKFKPGLKLIDKLKNILVQITDKNQTSNGVIKKTTDAGKIVWEGTKSEFAVFVNEEYATNPKKYKSKRDVSNKLFEKYEFSDKNWTKAKCYDIVRK